MTARPDGADGNAAPPCLSPAMRHHPVAPMNLLGSSPPVALRPMLGAFGHRRDHFSRIGRSTSRPAVFWSSVVLGVIVTGLLLYALPRQIPPSQRRRLSGCSSTATRGPRIAWTLVPACDVSLALRSHRGEHAVHQQHRLRTSRSTAVTVIGQQFSWTFDLRRDHERDAHLGASARSTSPRTPTSDLTSCRRIRRATQSLDSGEHSSGGQRALPTRTWRGYS